MSSIKEKLLAIKALFNTAPPPAPSPAPLAAKDNIAPAAMTANLVGYPVDGGMPIYTDISDDSIAGLDANDYVFTDESMGTPYPDGTYNVTGTDFGFTVTGGCITNITNPSGTGAGQPLPDVDIEAAKESMVPPPPTTTDVPVKPAAVTPESMKQMYASQDTLKAKVLELEAKLTNQEAFSKQVLELVEMVANVPTSIPATLPENKKEGFNSRKEAQLQKMAEAISEAKKRKKIN